MKTVYAALCGFAAMMIGPSTLAHHSFAMFDIDKTVEIKGTVKEFQFTNPHIWLYVNVPQAGGNPAVWDIEGGSPNAMVRLGIRRDIFKPGDVVTIRLHPRKDGKAGGSLVSATLADGAHFGE
jgi:hypothetical protein